MNKLMLNSQNGKAAALMVLAVFCWSFMPLFIAWGSDDSPFIFNAAWKLGAATVCIIFLMVVYRSLIFRGDVWSVVWRRIADWSLLFWVISYFSVALYAWSTQFIDVSVTAVLYEVYLILLVLVTGRLFRNEGRYRKITPLGIFLFILALAGVACVIASQTGGLGVFSDTASMSLSSLVIGFALALGTVFLATMSAFGFRWAADLASDLTKTAGEGGIKILSNSSAWFWGWRFAT